MAGNQQQEAVPGDAGPTQSQLLFQQTVDSLAHHIVGLFVTTNIPPVMASLVCSQIIRAVMIDLVKTNPQVAKALLEELATGLVEFCAELGIEPDISSQGKTQQ